MINRRGPRQDPCGTPQDIDSIFESFPFTLQHCFLLVREEQNHFSSLSFFFSFYNNKT